MLKGKAAVIGRLVFFLLLGKESPAYQQTCDQQALSVLLKLVTVLINENRIEELETHIDPNDFIMVTPDAQIHVSPQDFTRYWTGLINRDSGIVKIYVDPKPISHVKFLSDTVGISVGTCQHIYKFADGHQESFQSIWTTILKKSNNEWRIASVHISANSCHESVVIGYKEGFFKRHFAKLIQRFQNLF